MLSNVSQRTAATIAAALRLVEVGGDEHESPAERRRRSAAVSSGGVRPTATMSAPARASATATPRPSPVFAPVTSACRSRGEG